MYLLITLLFILILPISCPKKKNRAPETPTLIGPTNTTTYNRKPELFKAYTTDPDKDDQVRFIFDWNDTNVDTTEYIIATDTMELAHAWLNAGTYSVKVKAQDLKGLESAAWSSAITMTVNYNQPPLVESIIGPTASPYYMLPNRLVRFSTIARDTTDSVYVRFIHKKKKAAKYTVRPFIGPKVSGSIFRDSITFAAPDTYLVRAIAKDSKGSESDTSQIYQVIVNNIKWEFHTYDPPGGGGLGDTTDYEFYSSPALAQVDGEWRLFIGALDGYFYCLDPANGRRKSRGTSLSAASPNYEEIAFNATPAVNEALGHIYCGSDEGVLYCFTTSGAKAWVFPYNDYDSLSYDEFGSSPAFKGNRVYVGCDDYKLYCLQDNGSTFSLIWSYDARSEIASSPAIDAAGNIYFGNDSGYVTSLAPSNGAVRWRNRIGIGVMSSPSLTTDRLYTGTDDGYLYALNLNTGAQIWRYTAGDGIKSTPIIAPDGSIYFGDNDGYLYGLTSAGTIKSGFPKKLSDEELSSTPAMTQAGAIIVYTAEDVVYAISQSGTMLWQFPLPGFAKKGKLKRARFETSIPSPTIGADGTIYIASAQAGIYAIPGTSQLAPPSTTTWPKFRHDLRNTGRVDQTR